VLEPVYEWKNTWSPVPTWGGGFFSPRESQFAVNRDYYLHTASFNGTSGVDSGLLSARPATCVVNVAYWATDTSTLYRCTATNTWTLYYKPYAYPHLLRQGTDSLAPAPPTNLNVSLD
jgi:hypothetical protein